jgi:hypothetical protein
MDLRSKDAIESSKQHDIDMSNILIAEFMGYEVRFINKCYSPKYNDGTIAPMQFHKSWDWLIPVLNKCFKTGDDTQEWDNIMDTLFTCDIDIVYAQIVEFIKNQNN